MPQITVLMPVYNAGHYLRQSLDSILRQTHRDFDFVIVDDGSTDIDTRQLLQEALSDNRVKLLTHPKRRKVACALNHGLEMATGEFIARMDADDISHPQRLEKQIEFMKRHPDIGLCGTNLKCFGRIQGLRIAYPQNPEEIKCKLLLSCSISHPTVMFRTASLERHQLRYNEKFETCEDYEFWTRLAMFFPMANLNQTLHYYRVHSEQDERNPARLFFLKRVIESQWDALDLSYSKEDLEAFFKLAHYPECEGVENSDELIHRVEVIFSRIMHSNRIRHKYDPEVLKKTLSWFWMTILAGERRYSWSVWRRFQRNRYATPSLSEAVRLLVKCLIRWEARDPRRLMHS